MVDLLDLGGSRQGKQLEKLAKDPHRVMANSRFLGRVEVPLSETLSHRRGDNLLPLLIPLHDDEIEKHPCGGNVAPWTSCSGVPRSCYILLMVVFMDTSQASYPFSENESKTLH